MRRVLHLISQRPGWTGSGVALDAIVAAAGRAGWEQRVVLGTPAEDPMPSVGGLDPSQIHPLVFEQGDLSFPLPGMSDVMPYRSSVFSQLDPEQLAAYREAMRAHLLQILEAFEPDVIHSHHIWLWSSWLKDLAPKTRVVTHCHGTGLRQLELCPHFAAEVRAGCARNDAFFALHADQARAIARELDLPSGRVHTVGSGFREDVFHARGRAASDEPVVAYAGKLSRAKGLPWLIDAIEQLAERIPGLVLHVAGSGSGAEADAIRERLLALRCVEFHGQLDQAGLSALLRRSAVFVLPSFYEGLPLVLVEAAACGCRLVSTSLPGVVDQLQPVLGALLTPVELPRIEGADRPVEADLPAFVERLASAIETALAAAPPGDVTAAVAGMTWDAVFERIEAVWQAS